MWKPPLNANLSPLSRADGSASCSTNDHSVVCAVNGPVEVMRRDELPEEAAIEVTVRPITGVGGIRERYFETILQNTLRHIILVKAHPRTLIQVTIQVTGTSNDGSTSSVMPQASSNISLLPVLVQSAALALLTTSISLEKALTSILVSVKEDGILQVDPEVVDLNTTSSLHALAFSSLGELLMVESEGEFELGDFERVLDSARQACCRDSQIIDQDGDFDVRLKGQATKDTAVRNAVENKIALENSWRLEQSVK